MHYCKLLTMIFAALRLATTPTANISLTSAQRFISKTSSLALFFVATSSARAFSLSGGYCNNKDLLLPSSIFGFKSTTSTRDKNNCIAPNIHTNSRSRSLSIITNTRGGDISSISSPFSRNFQRYSTLSDTDVATTTTITPEDQVKITSSKMTASEKLTAMRSKMKENGVDVYLVPSDDPHLSEYVPAAYMRRAYLTDFHGSAGTAVVTSDKAYLWTDSRYVFDVFVVLLSCCLYCDGWI